MSCTVYCLVPHPRQLERLVSRLKEAGIETKDIAVVPQAHWALPDDDAPARQPAAANASSSAVAASFWNLPFVSAALWWQLALGSTGLPPARNVGQAPIPLEQYEAGLKAGQGQPSE